MHKGSLILLSLISSLAGYDSETIDEAIDHSLNYNEAMEDAKIKLDLLVFRLLNDGFKEDEVYEMIDNLLPEGMENLSDDEKSIVRNDTKKLILKRKENLYYE